jgi:hypothetical protein
MPPGPDDPIVAVIVELDARPAGADAVQTA